MTTEVGSAEQLSIALMAVANRLHHMGGTIGADEHGFRAMGDQLAECASYARQLGVAHQAEKAELLGEVAKYKGSYETERLLSSAYEAKLAAVREAITKLEMERSDDPNMKLFELLTALAEFVERVEGALNE